jgi:quinol monooxygenase YgiN
VIIVSGEIVIEAGAEEGVQDEVRTMVSETRKEAGCINYSFALDMMDPTMVRIYECWESQEALAAHMQSPHMAAFRETIGKVGPKSVNVKFFDVAGEIERPG